MSRRTRTLTSRYAHFPYIGLPNGNYIGTDTRLTFFGSMTDSNNGASRPESQCSSVVNSVTYMPMEYYTGPNGGIFGKTTSKWYPPEVEAACNERISRLMIQAHNRLEAYVLKSKAGMLDRFSAINFALELGDLPELFKNVRQSLSNLEKFRSNRRAGRPLDEGGVSEFRYITWEFAVAPFLADLGRLKEGITSNLSSQRKLFESFSNNTPLRKKFSGVEKFIVYTDHGELRCTIEHEFWFVGHFRLALPVLTDFDADFFQWLDNIGFHPDASVVWEAIPFSWMVDWFVPIGQLIEDLSPRLWYQPDVHMTGTFHQRVKIRWEAHVDRIDLYGIPWSRPRLTCHGVQTRYERSVYADKHVYRRPVLNPKNFTFDLRKIALLSDIWGPTAVRKRSRKK